MTNTKPFSRVKFAKEVTGTAKEGIKAYATGFARDHPATAYKAARAACMAMGAAIPLYYASRILIPGVAGAVEGMDSGLVGDYDPAKQAYWDHLVVLYDTVKDLIFISAPNGSEGSIVNVTFDGYGTFQAEVTDDKHSWLLKPGQIDSYKGLLEKTSMHDPAGRIEAAKKLNDTIVESVMDLGRNTGLIGKDVTIDINVKGDNLYLDPSDKSEAYDTIFASKTAAGVKGPFEIPGKSTLLTDAESGKFSQRISDAKSYLGL